MKLSEIQWNSIKFVETQWKRMKFSENLLFNKTQWISVKFNETQWRSMKIYETQWKSMKIYETQWNSLKLNEIQVMASQAFQVTSIHRNSSYLQLSLWNCCLGSRAGVIPFSPLKAPSEAEAEHIFHLGSSFLHKSSSATNKIGSESKNNCELAHGFPQRSSVDKN